MVKGGEEGAGEGKGTRKGRGKGSPPGTCEHLRWTVVYLAPRTPSAGHKTFIGATARVDARWGLLVGGEGEGELEDSRVVGQGDVGRRGRGFEMCEGRAYKSYR